MSETENEAAALYAHGRIDRAAGARPATDRLAAIRRAADTIHHWTQTGKMLTHQQEAIALVATLRETFREHAVLLEGAAAGARPEPSEREPHLAFIASCLCSLSYDENLSGGQRAELQEFAASLRRLSALPGAAASGPAADPERVVQWSDKALAAFQRLRDHVERLPNHSVGMDLHGALDILAVEGARAGAAASGREDVARAVHLTVKVIGDAAKAVHGVADHTADDLTASVLRLTATNLTALLALEGSPLSGARSAPRPGGEGDDKPRRSYRAEELGGQYGDY